MRNAHASRGTQAACLEVETCLDVYNAKAGALAEVVVCEWEKKLYGVSPYDSTSLSIVLRKWGDAL